MHLHSRLLEFLNVAAKQLVSETSVLFFKKLEHDTPYQSMSCKLLLQNITGLENVSVANNACWAIGELAIKVSMYCMLGKRESLLNFNY